MASAEWKDEWSAIDYEWPVTAVPDASAVEHLGERIVATGGRAMKEPHADRGTMMDFPNGTGRIRKQVPRAECRRRAQIMVPPTDPPGSALKVCVVCDAVYLWPKMTEEPLVGV